MLTEENKLFTSLVSSGMSKGLLELTAIEERRTDEGRNRKPSELLGVNTKGLEGIGDCVTEVNRRSSDGKELADLVLVKVESTLNDVTGGEGVKKT